MIAAIVTITLIGSGLGLLLGVAAKKLHVDNDPLVDELTAMLPGSQCGQCGFPAVAPRPRRSRKKRRR